MARRMHGRAHFVGRRQRLLTVVLAVAATALLVPSDGSLASHVAHQSPPTSLVPGVDPPGAVKAVCNFSGGHIRDVALGTAPVHGHLGWFESQLACVSSDPRYDGVLDFEFDFDTDGLGFPHGEMCSGGYSNNGTMAVDSWHSQGSGWAKFDRSGSSLTMWGFLDYQLGPDDYIQLDLRGDWCLTSSWSTTGTAVVWGPVNSAPEGPWLVEPRNGYAFSSGEDQTFWTQAWDYENDAWGAQITVRDSTSNDVVDEFVIPSSNGFDAVGTPLTPLPPGDYSWTAVATDAKGASSDESDPEFFSVR